VALVLALTATACGSRLSEQDRAQAVSAGGAVTQAGGPGGGGLAAGPTGDGKQAKDRKGAKGGGAGGQDAASTGSPGAGGGPGSGGGGGQGSSGGNGGAGEGGGGGPAGPAPGQDEAAPPPTEGTTPGSPQPQGGPGACRPSAGGAPGVSQGEVKVGNVSTMSGPVPGFGQTGVAGVRAYFNMVNATGGVCGRKLTLLTGDDRLQAASNRSETEKLSDQVLAFVGNTTVTDDGGTPVIEGKKIPDVSLSISEARIRSAFNFSPNPIDLGGVGSGVAPVLRHMAKTYNVSRAAIIYPEQASAKARALEYRQDFEQAGIEVVEEFSVAVTETNFSSQVNTMKNSNVDIVITALEVNGMARLAQAFDQARWFPKVPFYGAQVYGKKFLELAGSAANGTIVGFSFAIPEDRGSNPAVAKLHEWYTKSNPGLDFDFFAIMGWIAADMFVTALRNTGANPTRANLHAELSKFTSYQGGGLVGTINPAQKKPAQCFMIAKVANGAWQREFPGQGFQC
jgi:ABC-type branched-subunit amino acid transport system substrate-binding protein